MVYRNKKTGVVIDVSSVLKGDWEPVEKPVPKAPAVKKTTPRKKGTKK